MARPIKTGLDYFPIDVDMESDDKIELIEAVHGVEGFGIIVKLLMRIYRHGYYYPWTDKEKTLFSAKIQRKSEQVQAVVDDAIRWGFFDEGLYEKYQILTSAGIQKRYLEATKRRDKVILYALILLTGTNAYRNVIIVDDNPVNVDNGTQSKGKESKGKESKGKKLKERKEKVEIPGPCIEDYVLLENEYFKLFKEKYGEEPDYVYQRDRAILKRYLSKNSVDKLLEIIRTWFREDIGEWHGFTIPKMQNDYNRIMAAMGKDKSSEGPIHHQGEGKVYGSVRADN